MKVTLVSEKNHSPGGQTTQFHTTALPLLRGWDVPWSCPASVLLFVKGNSDTFLVDFLSESKGIIYANVKCLRHGEF